MNQKPKISVLIPNRNDVVMLAITVRSALEACKGVDGGGEVVIVDNSDLDLFDLLNQALPLHHVKTGDLKIIRQDFPCMFTARQEAANVSEGKYLFNVDSHNLFGHNLLKDSVDFMENCEKFGINVGFGHPPMGWCAQHPRNARHEINVDEGTIYGRWGRQFQKPRKICWKFGPWIANREWFLNKHRGYGPFVEHRLRWGGGEFFVAMKGWMLGYENWAIPTDPLYHIGPFTSAIQRKTGYRYRLFYDSGEHEEGIGIFTAFACFGSSDEMKPHALAAEKNVRRHHAITVETHWEKACRLAANERQWLEKEQVVSFTDFMNQRPWDG